MGKRASFPGLARIGLAVFFVAARIASAGETGQGPTVIATLFPQYDFSRRIAGDKARVRLLLPPGAESHSFEPTPSDMKAIAAADLFIYTGEYMEPWAKRLADAAGSPQGVKTVDASRGVTPRPNDEHHDDGEDGAHFHEFDPHIWLDPRLAAVMVVNIEAAFVEADPENADFYRKNADSLRVELEELDAFFRTRVNASRRRTLVFGERFAFAYLFSRYGLEEIGAYKSCAPGAEPGLSAVIAVIRHVRENGVRFIYLEDMSTGRISEIIHKETGAEILRVDSLHNPPAEVQASGAGYVDIMRRNLEAFARGLE